METMYYQTRHFIRHQGNVIDLQAYRAKLAELEAEREASAERTEERSGTREERAALHWADRVELAATVGVAAAALSAAWAFFRI